MGLFRSTVIALALGCCSAAAGAKLPAEIARRLPPDHLVLTSATSTVGPGHIFYFVALGSRQELTGYLGAEDRAPARPLLIFERRPRGRYVLAGRNDDVILRADDAGIAGNGCDPFEERQIAVKGRYFTVENGVACGAHWTDYVTFRFEPRHGYVFDNARSESWSMNLGNDPNAEALTSDGVRIERPPKGQIILFSRWRRPPIPQ